MNRVLLTIGMLCWLVAGAVVVLPWFGGESGVTRITYVYEKDRGAVPADIQDALDEVSKTTNIVATEWEDDRRNADGEVAAQYRVAHQKAGTVRPVLVIEAGSSVEVDDTPSAAEILEYLP